MLSDPKKRARRRSCASGLNAPSGAQCFPTGPVRRRRHVFCRVSMHLLVLSAFRRPGGWSSMRRTTWSQCTFWCSVLSDFFTYESDTGDRQRLNAPSGAQCFPTSSSRRHRRMALLSQCTFWCSVLSDCTLPVHGQCRTCLNAPSGAQCFPTDLNGPYGMQMVWSLNAPSGAQCFPTNIVLDIWHRPASIPVSMHLLVLSAFRPGDRGGDGRSPACLNAPSGAQCFPTLRSATSDPKGRVSMHLLVLSAFRREGRRVYRRCRDVSMHLLVLSAFRRFPPQCGLQFHRQRASQCTFWCSVLSDTDAAAAFE